MGTVRHVACHSLVAAVSLAAARLPAQDSTTAPDSGAAHAPADPAVHYVESALRGLHISGYAEGSYAYSTAANGTAITGRLYDRFQDQFALNALALAIDKPYAADKLDAGFHAELVLGQNAGVLKSAGLDLGSDGDLTQLYATLNIPTANGNGFQLKLGKIATLLGLEVIEDIANPNWSEGNQFVFVENFTALGVSAEYKLNTHLDAQLRLSNGWDVVQDNNSGKSFMGRIGVYPDSVSAIGVVGYVGPEEADDSHAKRYGGEVLLNRRFSSAVAAWVQADVGREGANAALPDPTHAATWWAVGGWLTYDVTSTLGVALRADYLDDRDGARTSAAFSLPAGGAMHHLTSGTVTLNVRSWSHVLLRPEVRYDRSNLQVFDGGKSQVTVGVSLAYVY